MFPQRSIEHHRRRPGGEVSTKMSEHVWPAHWRILAAMGPASSSMASLATVDSSWGPVIGTAQPTASDEQTQAYNRKWTDWIRSLVQAGSLESGLPLTPTAKEVTKNSVSDRSLQAEDVYGYLLVNAPSLDAVVDLVRQAPHTELGGKTIIRPCHEVPDVG